MYDFNDLFILIENNSYLDLQMLLRTITIHF